MERYTPLRARSKVRTLTRQASGGGKRKSWWTTDATKGSTPALRNALD